MTSVHAPSAPESYAATSYWLESCGDDLTPRKSVSGDGVYDVAILGGGFSGLWTAYYLLRDNPGLSVAIVEREICGYGASGRNGGWCSPRYPLDASTLIARYGVEAARNVMLAMQRTVDEVGRVCVEEEIDAEFRRTGILSLARGDHQLPAIQRSHQAYERLGLGHDNILISAAEARARVNVTQLSGALHTAHSACLHPGKLVRGLARVVERLGGTIFERTEVVRIRQGAEPRLITAAGDLVARRAIVAAGEAYLTQQPGFQRALLPMSSLIVLTEPLTETQWTQIGWRGGEGLASQVSVVDYLTKTTDGRILYGSRGAPYHLGSNVDRSWDEPTADTMRRTLLEWFPILADVGFSHGWAGHLGVTRDWTPNIVLGGGKLGQMFGYTGRGVSTTNLCGRMLASAITGRPSGFETLPTAGHVSPLWEVEPFRFLGVRYVQEGFHRIDAAAKEGRGAPIDAPLVRWLSKQ
ncbi:FAD-binding oxidoreductase [uncultured Caulobacter sp.]|uniref:NAD(P)/FAD-dependent oxidoreductase n=1 Tax=uncultured Caulobacter sp. TaxID=158749 RepID=UPI0026119777|nr:FAD-dependent oxidoreductase [uncultured Caulobacter sp.]